MTARQADHLIKGNNLISREKKHHDCFEGTVAEMSRSGSGDGTTSHLLITRLNSAVLGYTSWILWGLCLSGVPTDVKDNARGSTHKSYLTKSMGKGKKEEKVELVNLE